MKNSSVNKPLLSDDLAAVRSVSRKMVQQRASELALSAGRRAYEVRQADYEQAKLELTGELDTDRQNAILDAPPARDGWSPDGGSPSLGGQPA